MSSKIKPPRIVTLAILTTVTVFMWIGFEIYFALTKEPETGVEPYILETLTPELDFELLSEIDKSVFLKESEIGEINYESSTEDNFVSKSDKQDNQQSSNQEQSSEESTISGELKNE